MKIVELTQTCYACPSQWEGKLENGSDLYIRCRHGYLSVEVNSLEILGKDVSVDGIDGVISIDEVMQYISMTGITL